MKKHPIRRKKKHPEPFYLSYNDCWYVLLGKEQIPLVKGEDREDDAWGESPCHGRTRPCRPLPPPDKPDRHRRLQPLPRPLEGPQQAADVRLVPRVPRGLLPSRKWGSTWLAHQS